MRTTSAAVGRAISLTCPPRLAGLVRKTAKFAVTLTLATSANMEHF